jgi:Fic family protein
MIQFPEKYDPRKALEYAKVFISESNLIEREEGELDPGSGRALDYLIQHQKLTPKIIEKAHFYLMCRKKGLEKKYIGKFRDCTIYIGREKRDNQLMINNEVMDWLIKERQAHGAGDFLKLHFEFEKIHPFADGNGRIGRLLYLSRVFQNSLKWKYFSNEFKRFYYKEFEDNKKGIGEKYLIEWLE